MMFAFAPPAARRRPSLTPMIDVVFLLLVFFMLAARFGQDMAIPLTGGTGVERWEGAPRLLELSDDGLRLNGQPVTPEGLTGQLGALMPAPDAPVILRATGAADLTALTALLDRLRAAGIRNVVLVE
ncbi:MAG: biopolymer transporter ExbD [Aestuariivita sp.]|uniref:ExbD/TolR family protein n=1 Tax=Aestuariivita sp. TaxID=1872407 RepID=UPI003BB21E9E